ncbi:MAG: type II toxin-antitoxin system HicA family toxin [Segetibacter sp.]|nr:type II toxin-antitoxin system HicA family toxin [Segetibacter sp.]
MFFTLFYYESRGSYKLIEKDGWVFKRQKGSHIVFVHPNKTGIVVVPNHGLNVKTRS